MREQQESKIKSKILVQERCKAELLEFCILLRSVPTMIITLFIIAVFLMNLVANKSIQLPFEWMALDCGIVVSWFVFLVLDILTKHFGPKAATQLSFLATVVNLGICGMLYIISRIPGSWSESYVPGSEEVIGNALDHTFGGVWYIILGSAFAFMVSSGLNNFLNECVGKVFHSKPDSILAYLTRSYVSTAVGQFADNFIFAFTVSRVFFGWTLIQCIMCSLFGMLAELICEIFFSLWGYQICRSWQKNKIGEEYLCYRRQITQK